MYYLSFVTQNASGITMGVTSVAYWCKSTDWRQFIQSLEEINLEIKKQFAAAGLEFAYPTQTIHLRPVPA